VSSSAFITTPLKERADLLGFNHHGEFILFYDRSSSVAYGYAQESSYDGIDLARKRTFDGSKVQSLPDLEEFFNIGLNGQVECTQSIVIANNKAGNNFFKNFDRTVFEFRELGYPMAGASYVEVGGGYNVTLSYFSECPFLEEDLEIFVESLRV